MPQQRVIVVWAPFNMLVFEPGRNKILPIRSTGTFRKRLVAVYALPNWIIRINEAAAENNFAKLNISLELFRTNRHTVENPRDSTGAAT